MKKIALVLLVCMATFAAPKAHAGLIISNKMGVKGGLTFFPDNLKASIPFVAKSNITYNTGFHVGIADRLTLLKLLYVQPELLYNRSSYDLSDGTGTKVHTNLVNVPVAVGLHLGFMRVYAGPVLNVYSNSGYSGSAFKSVTTTFPTLGYQGGVGFSILMVDVDFKINGTGSNPTQNFINNDNTTSTVKLAKFNLMLSVGVMF